MYREQNKRDQMRIPTSIRILQLTWQSTKRKYKLFKHGSGAFGYTDGENGTLSLLQYQEVEIPDRSAIWIEKSKLYNLESQGKKMLKQDTKCTRMHKKDDFSLTGIK